MRPEKMPNSKSVRVDSQARERSDVTGKTGRERLMALVPAGGIGERANLGTGLTIPKQYRPILGQSMLRRSVQALLACDRIEEVFVGVQPDDGWAKATLEGLDKVSIVPHAGQTRALTVLNVLQSALDEGKIAQDDWVLVHDAARPGLPLVALEALIDTCLKDNTGGLLAVPATDTIKRAAPADGEGPIRSAETLPRETIWFAQTPQMFRAGRLADALRQGLAQGLALTDEASAMELAGLQPLLVPGSTENFKVTWPQDFERMEKVFDGISDRSGV